MAQILLHHGDKYIKKVHDIIRKNNLLTVWEVPKEVEICKNSSMFSFSIKLNSMNFWHFPDSQQMIFPDNIMDFFNVLVIDDIDGCPDFLSPSTIVLPILIKPFIIVCMAHTLLNIPVSF